MEEERNVQLVESSEMAQKLKELKEHIEDAESTLLSVAMGSLEYSQQGVEALFMSQNGRLTDIADLATKLRGDVDDLRGAGNEMANENVRAFIFSVVSRRYAKCALR